MTESEFEYLRRRATEELEIADRSRVPIAAEVHRRLALLYAKRVAKMRTPPRLAVAEPIAEPMAMPQMASSSQ